MSSVKRVVTIQNKKGLHARAAAKFVKTAGEYDADIRVTRLGADAEALKDESIEWTVSARSILGLMMLGAEPGVELELEAEGGDAENAINALELLVNDKFDEGE